MNSPTPIAYIIETFKNRDDWIKLFLSADDDELSFTAKVVGVRIALHHNIETGQCNPSLPQLAAGTGMSERHVRRMLRELEETGWLCTDQSLGRHTHSFELTVPTNQDNGVRDQVSDPDTSVRVPDSSTRTMLSGLPGQTGSLNPDTVVRQKRESRTANRKAKGEDSPQLDLADEDSGRRSQNLSDDVETLFQTFYAQYPKKRAKAKALQAYRVALKKGATPEVLVTGAMRVAADFERDAARRGRDTAYQFLAHPASWLNGGGWEDEPTVTASYSTPPPSGHHAISEQIARQLMEKNGDGNVH